MFGFLPPPLSRSEICWFCSFCLLSWNPPLPTQCGRHISMAPKHQTVVAVQWTTYLHKLRRALYRRHSAKRREYVMGIQSGGTARAKNNRCKFEFWNMQTHFLAISPFCLSFLWNWCCLCKRFCVSTSRISRRIRSLCAPPRLSYLPSVTRELASMTWTVHWISLSTRDMGLEQIRAISDSRCT